MKFGLLIVISAIILTAACVSEVGNINLPTGFASSFEQTRGENIPSDWFRTLESKIENTDEAPWDENRTYVYSNGYEGSALYFNSDYDPDSGYAYMIKSKTFKVNPGSTLTVSYYIQNKITCSYPAKDWECNGVSLFVFNNMGKFSMSYDLFSFNDKFEYDCCANFETDVENLGNGWYKVTHMLDPLPNNASFAQVRLLWYNKEDAGGYFLIDNVVVS